MTLSAQWVVRMRADFVSRRGAQMASPVRALTGWTRTERFTQTTWSTSVDTNPTSWVTNTTVSRLLRSRKRLYS